MIKKLVFLLLCWSSMSQAETRPWTDDELYWGTALGVAILSDWSSTRYAARHGWPDNTRESNPLLGSHPSVSRVDKHFLIVVPAIFWLLNQADEDRKNGLMAATALEIYAGHNNAKLGLRFRF